MLAINGSAIETYEPIAQPRSSRGWEFIGHGFTQKNMQKVDDERDDIRKTAEAIARFTGKRAARLARPGPDRDLGNAGPPRRGRLRLRLRLGARRPAGRAEDAQRQPIVNMPYTQECNDVAMMLIQHHTAREYRDRAIDQFEQLYDDARESARVMALVVHPYIMGAPHRLKYFRSVLETHPRHATACCSGPASRFSTGTCAQTARARCSNGALTCACMTSSRC